MASYRFLEDAFIGQDYYQAGSVASTADVGGTLPIGWIPNPNVDPQDAAGTLAFYNAGPRPLGLVRTQSLMLPVLPPTTYWKSSPIAGSPAMSWTLTGLGAAFAAVNE
jgi:hypothetical protein